MMEQTVNQFNKGLQLDLYPMVQGNDVLSDCLNGTMITMSGNEVVLQNDMGNRRIDNAFLPVGYEPVGIKEYGGIIYVAAYNPITNNSQIGSFPSPERKINHLDDSNLKGELNLSDLNNSYNKKGINYLTRDSLLIPLTKDTSLHAGDKFVVYGNIDSSNITNYNNSDNNKAKTPKNKLYTLALGVLNSQNEFVDITKTLVRWNTSTNKIIKFGEDATDIYKFNTGYFIASSLPDDLSNMTQDDQQLLQERLKCPANTYSYKLVGPLYLKATLNHISGFNYNIYGIKNGDTGNSYTIWIEADITYNCPDGVVNNPLSKGNEYYESFEEGNVAFNAFTLYHDNETPSPTIIGDHKTKYDPTTNLYSVKIVKKYSININEGETYKYTIAVDSGISGVYLEGLSNSGEINPLLLGSNTVKINEWRFSNNYEKQETTLTYSFNAYPEYGKTFDNLQFKFIPYEKNSNGWNFNSTNAKTIQGQLYNGRVTTQLSWNAVGLEPRTLYKVEYSYNEVENGNPAPKTSTETRWFLTTELFNECYNLSLDTGVKDFGNSNDDSYSNIEALLKVVYALDANATGLVTDTRSGLDFNGTSLLTRGNDIKYIIETQKDLEISLNYNVLINENLYPNFIIPKNSSDILSVISVDNVKLETEKIEQEIISGSGRSGYISEDECTPKLLTENSTTTNTFIKRTISTKDIFSSDVSGDNNSKYIENGFVSFLNYYVENYKNTNSPKILESPLRYATAFLDFTDNNGDDDHYYLFAKHTDEHGLNHNVHESYADRQTSLLDEGDQNGVYDKWYTDGIGSKIQDCLNSLGNDVVFTWVFNNNNSGDMMWFSSIRAKTDGDGGEFNDAQASRVWWRTSQNTWALCQELIKNENDNFKNFIKKLFKLGDFTDYKFAYYKRVSLNELSLNSPGNNQSRTKHFDQEATIKWDTIVSNYTNLFEEIPQNDFLNFEINNLEDNIKNSYTTNISTSESFENTISKKDSSVFSNVDIDSLKFVDYKGQDLDANKIYRVTIYGALQSDLIPYDTYDFIVSDNFGGNDRRAIVYNKDNPSAPSQRYDNRGSDMDSMTVLDFSGVNVAVL